MEVNERALEEANERADAEANERADEEDIERMALYASQITTTKEKDAEFGLSSFHRRCKLYRRPRGSGGEKECLMEIDFST